MARVPLASRSVWPGLWQGWRRCCSDRARSATRKCGDNVTTYPIEATIRFGASDANAVHEVALGLAPARSTLWPAQTPRRDRWASTMAR